ncbi:hypothetical protein SAMN05421784_1124 [Xenorhabdus koppenhoeferi]|uniref:N-acetylmuramoyl-L-alanine amidase n=1 Tax=Xenorhabdus koppenhoeferi TaxID=351659 RepID=A0A1I7H8I6_9GAMM|nr:hypothetical protein SAMN05421784_1124 [Xenorhabdus koppenhoeferi]
MDGDNEDRSDRSELHSEFKAREENKAQIRGSYRSPQIMLISQYLDIRSNITGHSDIAPDRKTDPGHYFYWEHYKQLLKE